MTSKNIKVNVRLTLTPVGEEPEVIRTTGTLIERGEKSLLQFEDRRIQIEKERVLIRQNYLLELCPGQENKLIYPTPYGELSMVVRTNLLEVAEDRRLVNALYSLYTNGELIHKIRMNLKLEEEK